jgi:AcrR family transcriptional regulator
METKEKIFITAAKLFAEQDYYKVSVREICEKAEVTKPSLYYYFKDKQTLLEELIKDANNYYFKLKALHVHTAKSVRKTLIGYSKLYIDFVRNQPEMLKFMSQIQFMNIPETLKENERINDEKELNEFTRYIARQQKEGRIKPGIDPVLLCHNFWGMIIIVFALYLMKNYQVDGFEKNLKLAIEFWIEQFVIE